MSTATRIGLLVAGLLLAAGATAGERLKSAEISATFQGATFDGNYRDGGFFTETYAEDGTIRYADGRGTDMGTWSVDRDMFCTLYDKQEGACFYVVRESANCFLFYEPRVAGGGEKVPREEWTSHAWDRAKPSTCTIGRDVTI